MADLAARVANVLFTSETSRAIIRQHKIPIERMRLGDYDAVIATAADVPVLVPANATLRGIWVFAFDERVARDVVLLSAARTDPNVLLRKARYITYVARSVLDPRTTAAICAVSDASDPALVQIVVTQVFLESSGQPFDACTVVPAHPLAAVDRAGKMDAVKAHLAELQKVMAKAMEGH
jgi:hypothetical protein